MIEPKPFLTQLSILETAFLLQIWQRGKCLGSCGLLQHGHLEVSLVLGRAQASEGGQGVDVDLGEAALECRNKV